MYFIINLTNLLMNSPGDWQVSFLLTLLQDFIYIKFRNLWHAAAAAAKSLQSCPTLCDPRDGSPPGFPVPGILQARTLEWVAILLLQCMKVKSESEVAQSCHDMLRRRFLSIFLSGFFFFFLWMHCMNCRILVPLPAIEPEPSSVRACSSNHWTTRKFPHFHYILFSVVFVWNIFCSVSNP